MILVKPSHEIMKVMGDAVEEQHGEVKFDGEGALHLIETAGRTCYKSEDKINMESHMKFVKDILKRGHESVIEHSAMTVKFICDRGVTHEIVRHRLAAYSQESTRYCNYSGGVTFVIPPWTSFAPGEFEYGALSPTITGSAHIWFRAMVDAEQYYISLLTDGWSPQQARSVLPNSLKTEIVMTANFREWRHIFKLRCSNAAHPQMREIMIPLHKECMELIPVIFDDIEY